MESGADSQTPETKGIWPIYRKNNAFLCILWSKFLLKIKILIYDTSDVVIKTGLGLKTIF